MPQKWLKHGLFQPSSNLFLLAEPLSRRGTRQAPECLDSVHISVRLRELLKAKKRHFYRCSPFAEICPSAISTYNTAGRREAIVSTCSPLLDRFMIKVSTQYTVNLVGILVAYLGRSPIKLLSLVPLISAVRLVRCSSELCRTRHVLHYHTNNTNCPYFTITSKG
jgi:hypothetical protein